MDWGFQAVSACYSERMTTTMGETYGEAVAAEVRAWMGRRGMNQRQLAEALGEDTFWVSRRVSQRATGRSRITVDDLASLARVLGCSVQDLLPRLDSNQEPSGIGFAQVIDGLVAA